MKKSTATGRKTASKSTASSLNRKLVHQHKKMLKKNKLRKMNEDIRIEMLDRYLIFKNLGYV